MIFNSRSKFQDGFSLLEVLIAITILGFITLAIIQFTDGSIDKSLTVTAEDAEYLQVETAMARLEWDISQIYSPLYFDIPMNPSNLTETEGQIYNQLADEYQSNANFTMVSYDGLPIPLFRRPEKSSLVLFTTSNRRKVANSKQSYFAWVKYELQDTPQEDIDAAVDGAVGFTAPAPEDSKILVRKMFTNNVYTKREIEWDTVKSQILMRKVINLKFEFWNPKTKKWVENLDVIPSGANKIHAVRVTLDYYDPDNIETKTVRIFRTLFPNFEPEDKYKYLKPKKPNTNLDRGGQTNTGVGGEGND